jgi:hypothetical protein
MICCHEASQFTEAYSRIHFGYYVALNLYPLPDYATNVFVCYLCHVAELMHMVVVQLYVPLLRDFGYYGDYSSVPTPLECIAVSGCLSKPGYLQVIVGMLLFVCSHSWWLAPREEPQMLLYNRW